MVKPPYQKAFINLFHVTVLFLYPLKTSEYQVFYLVSGGLERDQWHEMGLNRKKKVGKIKTKK